MGCRQDLVEIALMRKDNDEAERHCRALMAMTEKPLPSEVRSLGNGCEWEGVLIDNSRAGRLTAHESHGHRFMNQSVPDNLNKC